MDNELCLINPIIMTKPGECLDCGRPICVVQRDMVDLALNAEGIPIRHEIPYTKTIGFCPYCGAVYPDIVHVGIFYDVRSLRYTL